MNLNRILNSLSSQFSEVQGISKPEATSQLKDLEIQFKPNTPKVKQDAAKAALLSFVDVEDYKDKRKMDYSKELSEFDRLESLQECVLKLIQLVIDKGVATEQELRGLDLYPDANKPIDTPAGMLGKREVIKTKYPKP